MKERKSLENRRLFSSFPPPPMNKWCLESQEDWKRGPGALGWWRKSGERRDMYTYYRTRHALFSFFSFSPSAVGFFPSVFGSLVVVRGYWTRKKDFSCSWNLIQWLGTSLFLLHVVIARLFFSSFVRTVTLTWQLNRNIPFTTILLLFPLSSYPGLKVSHRVTYITYIQG